MFFRFQIGMNSIFLDDRKRAYTLESIFSESIQFFPEIVNN